VKKAPVQRRGSPRNREAEVTLAPHQRIGELFLWLLVLLPPVVLFPSAKEAFRLSKLLVSEWLALASLLALAWGLFESQFNVRSVWRLGAVRATLPLLLVAAVGGVTTTHPLQFREAFFDLAIGVACLIGWSAALPSSRLARILDGLLWPATALALVGILQYHAIWRPLVFTKDLVDPRMALTSTAGNPGDLAVYLVVPCLLCEWRLARRLAERRQGAKGSVIFSVIAFFLCAYAIVLTQTLAAIAALVLGTAVLLAVAFPWRRVLAALGVGVILLGLAFVVVTPLRLRAVSKIRHASEGDWNAVLTGRLDGWRAALWMLRSHPLTGVGQGAFRPEFVPAKLALMDRGATFYVGQSQGVFANAHNEILEVGADLGIPGLAAIAWGLAVLLRAAAGGDTGRADGGIAADRAFAWSATATIGVLSLAHFPFRVALTAFPALLVLAWAFRHGDEAAAMESPAGVEAKSAGASRQVAAQPGNKWLAGTVLAGLAAALLLHTVRFIERRQGSRLLRQVELVSEGIETGRFPVSLVSANIGALRRAENLDAVEVGIPIALGSQYLLMPHPDPDQALAFFAQAERLEPRPAIYILKGRALLAAGRRDDADREFRLGGKLDPTLLRLIPPH
jgi:O-antigen ligase